MIKNLTSNQILLIILATALFLIAAVSFYLLQDPLAPLPFSPPSPSSTSTPLPPSSTTTPEPSLTSTPTHRTSYTPFVPTATKGTGTPATLAPTSNTGTPSTQTPTQTLSAQPGATTTRTGTPLPGAGTLTPTATQTLVAGQYVVTGRLIRNGTPLPNVKVDFADDVAPRLDTTDAGGHYWFITLAPGTSFTLKFDLTDNPQMTPEPEMSPLAWLEGTLPIGVETIQLPDLELSLTLDGMFFGLQTPVSGALFSASAITPSNPIQFVWSVYDQGEKYFVELGQPNNSVPIWISDDTTSTNMMWDGTLNNGLHITQGTYWWRVGVEKTLGSYTQIVYTQQSTLIFNP